MRLSRLPYFVALLFALPLLALAADSRDCLKPILARLGMGEAVPARALVMERRLLPLETQLLAKLNPRSRYSYVIDSKDRFYLIEGELLLSPSELRVIHDAKRRQSVLVREAGSFRFDASRGKVTLRPQAGTDLAPEEAEKIMARLEAKDAKLRFSREAPTGEASRVIECAEILAAQKAGKGLVLDRFVADNVIMATVIGIAEARGAGRFKTMRGRETVAADFVGNNLYTVSSLLLSEGMKIQANTLPSQVKLEIGMTLAASEEQKKLYELAYHEPETERTRALTRFNKEYSLYKLPFSLAFDRALRNTLPEMAFNACKSGSLLRVVVGPRSVRFVERGASSMLYYGLRKEIEQAESPHETK